MKANEYLNRMRNKLDGFSPQERQDFMDEIASHIESGQEDPSLGEERVMAELGTPEQMDRGLRKVHHPSRLGDLMLVLIPEFILFFNPIQLLLNVFYGPLMDWTVKDPHLYLGGRIAFVLSVLLAVIGLRRRSALLVIFWLTDGIGTLVSTMTREGRFIPGQEQISGSTLESLVLCVTLIGLAFWLVRLLRQNRFDLLLVVYALLPLMLMAANYSTAQILSQSNLAGQLALALPFGLSGILGTRLAWAIGISIFFLIRPRSVRWVGLLLVGIDYVFQSIITYSGSSQLLFIWLAVLAVVLFGWVMDWLSQRVDIRLVQ